MVSYPFGISSNFLSNAFANSLSSPISIGCCPYRFRRSGFVVNSPFRLIWSRLEFSKTKNYQSIQSSLLKNSPTNKLGRNVGNKNTNTKEQTLTSYLP